MPTLNPKITKAGLALFPVPTLPGFKVELTHVALGAASYKPTGEEVALQQEIARFPISPASGSKPAPQQVQIAVTIKDQDPNGNSPNGKWVGEIGFYSNDTLFAVWSLEPDEDTGKPNYLFYKTPAFDVPIAYTLDVSVLPEDAVTVNVSADPEGMAALILAHEAALNPHPQYLRSRAEILPGGLTQQFLRKRSNASGDWEWVDLTDGITVNVNTREESQVLVLDQQDVVLATLTTNGMVAYLGGGRLDKDIDFTIQSPSTFRLTRKYPPGTRITIAQNEVAGQIINPLDSTKNLADVQDKHVSRKSLEAAHVYADIVNVPVSNANVALSVADAQSDVLIFSGNLTAAVVATLPAINKKWVIWNNTTGNFALSVKAANGNSLPVRSGKSNQIWSDGANLFVALTDYQQATETLVGGAAVATQSDTDTGTDDTKFVTAKKLFNWAKQASETVLGLAKVATQALTNAGADDATFVSPKKLLNGFVMVANQWGYIKLPSWLGGFIFQWGIATVGTTQTGVTFPTAFPSACYGVYVMNSSGSPGITLGVSAGAVSGFNAIASVGGNNHFFFALGR